MTRRGLPWALAAAVLTAQQAAATPDPVARKAAPQGTKTRRAAAPRKPSAALLAAREKLEATAPVAIEAASAGALAAFFEKLMALDDPLACPRFEGAPAQSVRVLHFGDSHVAADYWTDVVRRRLQERFGDAGPGYTLPGRPWKYFRHARVRALGGKDWRTVGLLDAPSDGVLGLCGVRLESSKPGSVASVLGEGSRFEVQLAHLPGDGWPRILVDGEPYAALATDRVEPDRCGAAPADAAPECRPTDPSLAGGDEPALVVLRNQEPLAAGLHTLSVVAEGGRVRLLGLDLRDGRAGVVYDTLGMNGARLAQLDKWAPHWRQRLLAHAGPALIVVSYGTNDLGADSAAYFDEARGILAALRAEAPAASVLVTGPMERGSRYAKRRDRYLTAVDPALTALRDAALATGCAFWNARAAMGGPGSIATWVAAGYARRDQVHLTERGYERLGTLLADQLLGAYDSWRSERAEPGEAAEAR